MPETADGNEKSPSPEPPLAEPPAADQELNPGDRVEGLGDFGKPLREFGTVEQANEDDAVVEWDDDGGRRHHQPSLKQGVARNQAGLIRRLCGNPASLRDLV
jgi:hypothetical protein